MFLFLIGNYSGLTVKLKYVYGFSSPILFNFKYERLPAPNFYLVNQKIKYSKLLMHKGKKGVLLKILLSNNTMALL